MDRHTRRAERAREVRSEDRAMKKLKITQVRSVIGRVQKQRTTLKHLGLKKMGRSVVREDSASLQGMLKTVSHLVKVEEVTDAT